MTWKIEPSFGIEAFVTESFGVGLTQEQPGTTQTLIFSRSDIPALIEILKAAEKQAEQLFQQEVDNE